MIIKDFSGVMHNLSTGEVIGRTEEAPVAQDPRAATKQELPSNVFDKINQLSWGFNAALFALPDAAVRQVGKALGADEKETFQFSRLFNTTLPKMAGVQGERAPQNMEERYSRAIGEGTGNSLPFTGILAAVAKARPLVTAAEPAAGILKGLANDAIKMVQQAPGKAAALDIAFGAGWEGLRQAVEENVDSSNPYKQVYKELLPAAAFVGLPLAASGAIKGTADKLMQISPTAKAAQWASNKISGATSTIADVEKEAMAGIPKGFQLPIINIVPKMLIKHAENKLSQVFGPIAESKEAQEALRLLEAAMANPKMAEAGFVFDAAEKTMYAPLVKEKAALLEQMGPKVLEITKARINENQQALESLFSDLAPEARKPIQEAFQAAQADRQALFDSLLSTRASMTDAERLAVSERLGPQNIKMLNDELRGALMSDMELDNAMRQNTLRLMGLKQATSPEGLPLPTRAEGKSLFPSRNMESAATSLIEKYRPERPSMSVTTPEPIRFLERFVKSQQQQRIKLERNTTEQLVDQTIADQMGLMGLSFEADVMKAMRDSIMTLVRGEKPKTGRRTPSLAELAPTPDSKGNISVPTIIPGRKLVINPEQIKADAARVAEKNTQIDISAPEALDYLQSAMRFRNDQIIAFNTAMRKGSSRIQDAQRYLDTGNTVYKDIEKLILDHVPKIKQEYQGMKMVLDDYRAGYEQTLPLLMTQKKGRGEEYFMPNEQLMRTAFKSAENLKQLQLTLGNNPQAESLITRGAVDWLNTKGVVTADGLVDPKKIRQVLDKNRNIVEALPANVQAKFQDEVQLAEDYVKRIGELDTRRVNMKDDELDRVLARASRDQADPRQALEVALRDPAVMSKLVGVMEKDPEMLAALRRSIYEVATEGTKGGGALKTFIDNNEKSLKVLFKNTNHLDDLRTLADLQRRVNAFADVTGQIPAFESLDQGLKRVFGSGIQFITTTAREAAVGRISPETGALALLVRLTAGLENQLHRRIFTRALESEEFAKTLTHVSTPADGKKVIKQLQSIGVSPTTAMNAIRGEEQVAADLAKTGRPGSPTPAADLPLVPRETAREMLRRTAPPAPATRGVPQFNPRMPTTPQVSQGQSQLQLMYPAMFPNDPISGLLQQRQAQIQGPQR